MVCSLSYLNRYIFIDITYHFLRMNLQKLRSDLSQHRQLVRQLSSDATFREPREQKGLQQLPAISEDDLKRRWEEISAELANRKQSLKDLLDQKDSTVSKI